VIDAANELNLSIASNDLRYLFSNNDELKLLLPPVSARALRNKLAHDFGPQQVKNIVAQTNFLIPKMRAFLNCEREVLSHLKKHFSHLI
jgi:hypothetical protein